MARKIKFALEMADGSFVSNLEDLQKHIKNNDAVKKLVEYFLDGRLEKWLLDRYYEEEAKALQSVDKDDPDFTCKLCKAIGADYTPVGSVNIELIEYEKRMRKALEEVTLDSELIANADSTASTQSDLDFLIKSGKQTIYLFGDSFKLPLVHNISYIGILGKPLVDIDIVDLNVLKSYGIKFENVNLSEVRRKAKEEAKRKAEEERIKAEEEAKIRAEEEAKRKAEEEAEEKRQKAEEERIAKEAIRRQITNAKVGDYIQFGNYPQTANGQNQPIEWQVLSKKRNKMLVVSRYGIDYKRFDYPLYSSSYSFLWMRLRGVRWDKSEICQWLNGEFYNKAFTYQEKKYINSSNLSDVNTTDNVFLLSKEEAEKYFSNNNARKCKVTYYVLKKNNLDESKTYGYFWWWLRSPYPDDSYSVYAVNSDGGVSYSSVRYANYAVRPALWINLDNALESEDEEQVKLKKNREKKAKEEARRNPFKNTNVGDIVKFGSYPQTADGQEQPIEWQVLSKENNKMLVISKYGLDCKIFDSSSNNWANSEIRNLLNGEFYNKAFNDKEKKSIKSSNLSDVATTDNVLLLSKEEAEKYFVNNEGRRCKATAYAKNNGGYVNDNGYSIWWLRSPYPNNSSNVYYVGNDGFFYNYYRVCLNYVVVRPALWINL